MSHAELGFIRKYIFSTDHKVIAKQYLFTGIFWLLGGGLMAMMIRWQLAHPFDPDKPFPILGKLLFENGVMAPEQYNMLFTLHGSIMVFFAITPMVLGAFGNFVLPLQVGADDMAFPRLNMMSYWLLPPASLLVIISFFTAGGSASAGWTAYPPLAAHPDLTMGWGQTLWILSIVLIGTSSLMGSINYLVTMLNMRAKGMTLGKVPLTTWGFFFSSVINVMWIPVVAVALVMLLTDRLVGTDFFIAGGYAEVAGGQPLLYQHLFWGFGHPEVYILILPVWGMVAEILAVFSRKPAFGYRATIGSMAAITVLSQIVWGHHLFTSGMNPMLGTAFVFLTISISIPTAIFFLNWLGTLFKGSLQFTIPMQFTLGVIFVFSIGGLTGLFFAIQALDGYFHDTYFVVAHFHFTLAASMLLGAYAAVYYWFPKMFGKRMVPALGALHFWSTVGFLCFVFFGMFQIGLMGHPRRIADPTVYEFLNPVQHWNQTLGWATAALGLVQLFFVVNFLYSIFKGKAAGDNPWNATTLEWSTTSPPPHGNFPTPPEAPRGPYELSSPESEGTGRDWIGQWETSPAAEGA